MKFDFYNVFILLPFLFVFHDILNFITYILFQKSNLIGGGGNLFSIQLHSTAYIMASFLNSYIIGFTF